MKMKMELEMGHTIEWRHRVLWLDEWLVIGNIHAVFVLAIDHLIWLRRCLLIDVEEDVCLFDAVAAVRRRFLHCSFPEHEFVWWWW